MVVTALFILEMSLTNEQKTHLVNYHNMVVQVNWGGGLLFDNHEIFFFLKAVGTNHYLQKWETFFIKLQNAKLHSLKIKLYHSIQWMSTNKITFFWELNFSYPHTLRIVEFLFILLLQKDRTVISCMDENECK